MADQRQPSGKEEFAEEQASLVRITFGPLIWAVHFVASYAAAAVFCAKLAEPQDHMTLLQGGIAVATLLAMGGIAWIGWRSFRQWREGNEDGPLEEDARGSGEDRHQFLGHAAFLLAVISFVGVGYTAMPALFAASCR